MEHLGPKIVYMVAGTQQPKNGDEQLPIDVANHLARETGGQLKVPSGSFEEIIAHINAASDTHFVLVKGPDKVADNDLVFSLIMNCRDKVTVVCAHNDLESAYAGDVNLLTGYLLNQKPYLLSKYKNPVVYEALPTRVDYKRQGTAAERAEFFPDLADKKEHPPIVTCMVREVSDEWLDQLASIAETMHANDGTRIIIGTSPGTSGALEREIIERFNDPSRFCVKGYHDMKSSGGDDPDVYPRMIAVASAAVTTGTLSTTADLLGRPLFYLPFNEDDRVYSVNAMQGKMQDTSSPELFLRARLFSSGAMKIFNDTIDFKTLNAAREAMSSSWKSSMQQTIRVIKDKAGIVSPEPVRQKILAATI